MARPVSNGAFLEVTMLQKMNNQTLMNVFHYKLGSTTSVDGDAVAQILADTTFAPIVGVPGLLRGVNSNQWSYTGTKFQWIHPIRYTPTIDIDAAGNGVSVAEPLPQNVAAVLTKRAAITGKKNIGSTHFAGLTVDDVGSGAILGDRIINMLDCSNLLTQVIDVSAVPNALTLTPVIGPSTEPTLAQPWVDSTAQVTARVMRRRTVGVGI